MEINGDVTDAGRTDGRTNKRTREDRATQPMDAGWLSFARLHIIWHNAYLDESKSVNSAHAPLDFKMSVLAQVLIFGALKVNLNFLGLLGTTDKF